jgi:hypothetical protein
MIPLPARPGTAELPTCSAGVAGQRVAMRVIRRLWNRAQPQPIFTPQELCELATANPATRSPGSGPTPSAGRCPAQSPTWWWSPTAPLMCMPT